MIVLIAASMYFLIRFVAADLIGKWSVHRGMWHSIPAVLIFAGLAFLMSSPTDVFDRYLKAAAVGLGSFSHLMLDEVYSVDTRGVVPRFKKSFGSAVKFWGKKPWANFSTYAKLAVVVVAVLMDSMVQDRIELRNPEAAERLRVASGRLDGVKDRLAIRPREKSTPTEPHRRRPARASRRTRNQRRPRNPRPHYAAHRPAGRVPAPEHVALVRPAERPPRVRLHAQQQPAGEPGLAVVTGHSAEPFGAQDDATCAGT